MINKKEMIGKRFTRLLVIGIEKVGKRFCFLCQCDCGEQRVVKPERLTDRGTISCGCFRRERMTTHNLSRDPIYKTWQGLKHRCFNKSNKRYKRYGGRGITVCKRWMSFENFYKDMAPRPKGTSIERINNNKGYSKSNCKWATMKEQMQNTSRNVYIEHHGKRMTQKKWAESLGITPGNLNWRLKKWSKEKALTFAKSDNTHSRRRA